MVSKAIGIRPQAYQDIAESAEFIGRGNVSAARRFIDACDETFRLLSNSPQIGGLVPTAIPKLRGMRIFGIQGFPNHLVLYIEREASVDFLRVIHGARDLDALLPAIS